MPAPEFPDTVARDGCALAAASISFVRRDVTT
jgi:hypothetical protein